MHLCKNGMSFRGGSMIRRFGRCAISVEIRKTGRKYMEAHDLYDAGNHLRVFFFGTRCW